MKFESICRKTVEELKQYLPERLRNGGYNVVQKDKFIYAEGTVPILLVAHMDTVHKETVKEIKYELAGDRISSPQGIGGDDRCGIYMILRIIKEYHCSVLFTDEEETGGFGASAFARYVKKENVAEPNFIIEFDRKGSNDAVYYDLDNMYFEEFVTKESGDFFKTAYGSYTDICEIAPALGVAAVNLSCGYYNAHTTSEFVLMSEMLESIKHAKKLIEAGSKLDGPYVWKEMESTKWSSWDDYNYGNKKYYPTYGIYFEEYTGIMAIDFIDAANEYEALGIFFMEHPYVCYNAVHLVSENYYEDTFDAEKIYEEGKEVTNYDRF